MDWQNKRVMVTGGTGFIGKALVERLVDWGADVLVYDLELGDDVCNRDNLRHWIELDEIDLVYHLAAHAHVPQCNRHPFNALRTNILGSLNVLDICADLKIPCILASSDHAYGEAGRGFTKDTPLMGRHPYDLSKACADKIAQMYTDRGADVKIVRLCNVYGPGDTNRSRLIPYLIQCYQRGEVPVLRGSPDMLREWIYIDDAAQHYVDVAGKPAGIYPRGGEPATVERVVREIAARMGGSLPVISGSAPDEIHDLHFAAGECDGVTLDEGLERTIAWWRR